ncbi:hypothetical protein DC1_00014 [Burkholderia phage DC1]|uniref:Uncharacterized protein n=1 Tax=Burkholderia phage DC1 TaxID=2881398 RepID=I6NW15_9CAUD|nr:DksA-like zinc-finger protein [Burkholderia phage DC1]AEZ50833.1 hypothetical protein DC1_00014 [Burkholderia phage DC1]
MPDEIDLGNEQAQRMLDAAIAAARVRPAIPENLTECLNGCGDPPAAGARYCCPECATDHEQRMLVRQRQVGR